MDRRFLSLRRNFSSCLDFLLGREGVGNSVYDEMLRGAAVGCMSSLSMGAAAGVPLAGVLVAAMGGVCAGSVIGLLLWSGSGGLPEEAVLPPAPEQERSDQRAAPASNRHNARSR